MCIPLVVFELALARIGAKGSENDIHFHQLERVLVGVVRLSYASTDTSSKSGNPQAELLSILATTVPLAVAFLLIIYARVIVH